MDSIAILFTNQDGAERIKFLRFRDNHITEGHGAFIVPEHLGD